MKTNSDAPQTLYLGLDVHKAETVIAILDSERESEPRHYGTVATTQHALERAMRRIAKSQNRSLSDLHVCYEASGCGFWIARRLLQMGITCDVIAPSLIPTKSGDRIKTDKRDAMKLAKNLRSNDLVAVNIPDSTDEAIRDLCRARTDAVDDLRRAKTRLLALLRRLGYNYDGKTHWTEAHKRYLRQPQAASKPRKARKATAKAPATAKAGGDPWTRMVALKKEIDIMESKLASKKAEFSKLAGKL